jgi:hypothetical protein
MLTRQTNASETLKDIANWIQKIPLVNVRNSFQAEQIVCKK